MSGWLTGCARSVSGTQGANQRKSEMDWPHRITEWHEVGRGYMSIPFTWNLPEAKTRIDQGDFFLKKWIVGGPAVRMMPQYLQGIPGVEVSLDDLPGVLQRVNPLATRTTIGCPRRCGYCGVGRRKIEGEFSVLEDWPNLPVFCDNNMLAAGKVHFHRVMDRLQERWDRCDMNQGLEARKIELEHAKRLGELREAIVRLALDSKYDLFNWLDAVTILRDAGIPKANIRTYALIGYDSGPEEAWWRCETIDKEIHSGAYPMWYHSLDALKYNVVTEDQETLGWTEKERLNIMQWYYQHNAKYGGKPNIPTIETNGGKP